MKKSNKILLIVVSIVLCVTLLGAGVFAYASDAVKKNSIGLDTAIGVAMTDAGCAQENTEIKKAKLTFANGTFAYEIEFISGGVEYEYLLKASDGSIISREKENVDPADNLASSASGNEITLEQAKSLALKDAGVEQSGVVFTETKMDHDNGRDYYEIEFYTSSDEYDYEISLAGEIISCDKERRGSAANPNSTDGSSQSGGNITVSRAKEIALADAGVSASDATFTKAKMDHDDGYGYYEIKFHTASNEYEYEISLTGKILSTDREYHHGSGASNTGSTSQTKPENSKYIGVDKAKSIALNHSGLSSSAVKFTKAKLDDDDGVMIYEIEFYTDSHEYEYEINATTGKVLSVDKERHSGSISQTKPESSKYIGVDKAKSIALNHSGLSSSAVKFTKAKLDDDDGVMIYEIEFYTDSHEYEYEINATTGKVLSVDKERHSRSVAQTKPESSKYIGVDKAKSIALNHSGLSSSAVKFTKAKLDDDDGVMIYEIEFCTDSHEYEYEIHATTGKVYSHSSERA